MKAHISSLLLLVAATTTQALRSTNKDQTILSSDPTSQKIHDILASNEIIPQVLDDFTPTYTIDLSYPKHHSVVDLGNDLPVKHVQTRPTFLFKAINSSEIAPEEEMFTLILTDPDARSRQDPDWSEMCHWILTNLTSIPPAPESQTKKKLPGELVPYMAPSPPKKTGVHRYVFVLLTGNTTNIKAPEERKHWGYGKERVGVRQWAEENGLTVVGANFFFARNKKQ